MSVSRRGLLASAFLGLVAPAALADTAQAAPYYSKQTADLQVRPGPWVRLGAVQARRGNGVYVAQFALDKPAGRCVLRLRFNRNWNDGTGDQTYWLPPEPMVWNTTHLHTVSGFRGLMGTEIRTTRPVTVRYRILKARPM